MRRLTWLLVSPLSFCAQSAGSNLTLTPTLNLTLILSVLSLQDLSEVEFVAACAAIRRVWGPLGEDPAAEVSMHVCTHMYDAHAAVDARMHQCMYVLVYMHVCMSMYVCMYIH